MIKLKDLLNEGPKKDIRPAAKKISNIRMKRKLNFGEIPNYIHPMDVQNVENLWNRGNAERVVQGVDGKMYWANYKNGYMRLTKAVEVLDKETGEVLGWN